MYKYLQWMRMIRHIVGFCQITEWQNKFIWQYFYHINKGIPVGAIVTLNEFRHFFVENVPVHEDT